MASDANLLLAGAAVALTWMAWTCIADRTRNTERPRRRPSKIIRA